MEMRDAYLNGKRIPYRVAEDGRVWNTRMGHWIHGWVDRKGYRRVKVWVGDQKKCILVHRLVCETFGSKPLPGTQCRHMDGDSLNNSASNLAFGTAHENAADKIRHGTHFSKLTPVDVVWIRQAYKSGFLSQRAIGRRIGVSSACVNRVIKGMLWSRVEHGLPPQA